MTNSTKLTDLNRANEALPAKNVRCHHQNINPEQLCYVCKGENDVVDSLGSVHLEVDVEAMAARIRNIGFLPSDNVFEKVGNRTALTRWAATYIADVIKDDATKWARLVRK